MKRAKFGRIVLSGEEERWLEEHYPDTKNEELREHLGISQRSLNRIANRLKLRKTEEFMKQTNKAATDKALAHNRATGWAGSYIGAMVTNRKYKDTPNPSWFKTGTSGIERLGQEKEAARLKKANHSRMTAYARDRRRVALGLEPLTRVIKAVKMTHEECALRQNMKKGHGYLIFRGDPIVYYGPETTRSKAQEAHAERLGISITNIAYRKQ